MKRFYVALILLAAWLPVLAQAQVPRLITYQGRVAVNGTNFDGTGQFQFALVNGPTGTPVLWSNGAGTVAVPVSKGLYSVLLGDTNVTNMAALPATIFTNADVRLRIWFDGGAGLQQLAPDQRMAAVGYALIAASVPDGSITSNKIATGAIGTTQLASNLVFNGSIIIGNNNSLTPTPGTIRFTGSDFQGYTGTGWRSLVGGAVVTNPTPPAGVTPISNMVFIATNTFVMGSPVTELDRNADEGPQTTVTFTQGFYIAMYQVSQADFQTLKGYNPSYFSAIGGFTTDLTRSVEGGSGALAWADAVDYCTKLTTQERTAGHISTNWVYRLPTEAEWECACRAGTTTRFSWGDDLTYTLINSNAWYSGNSADPNNGNTEMTRSVGTLQPNPWGIYDMGGNVWEWCQDYYAAYPGGSVTNPVVTAGTLRVLRGNWCRGTSQASRSACRMSYDPTHTWGDVGFRVVLAPVP